MASGIRLVPEYVAKRLRNAIRSIIYNTDLNREDVIDLIDFGFAISEDAEMNGIGVYRYMNDIKDIVDDEKIAHKLYLDCRTQLFKEDKTMNDYWVSKAAEAEAKLDQAQTQLAELTKQYEQRIADLEKELLTANINASIVSASSDNQ